MNPRKNLADLLGFVLIGLVECNDHRLAGGHQPLDGKYIGARKVGIADEQHDVRPPRLVEQRLVVTADQREAGQIEQPNGRAGRRRPAVNVDMRSRAAERARSNVRAREQCGDQRALAGADFAKDGDIERRRRHIAPFEFTACGRDIDALRLGFVDTLGECALVEHGRRRGLWRRRWPQQQPDQPGGKAECDRDNEPEDHLDRQCLVAQALDEIQGGLRQLERRRHDEHERGERGKHQN